MSGSLDTPVARMERAARHYRTIKEEFHGGVDRKFRPVTTKCESEGLDYSFYVGDIEPFDAEVSFLVSEAYFNLRAALDQLVFQLHVRHFRGNVPPDAEEASAFPVILKQWKYKTGRMKGNPVPSSEWNSIKRLAARERTAIEWLQPYKGWGSRYPPDTNIGALRCSLSQIHDINRFDKHRDLHLVQAVLKSVPMPHFERRFGFKHRPAFGVPLKSNARVDRWTFAKPAPTEQVEMYSGVYTGIGIDPGMGTRFDVIPNLGGSILSTAMVIDRFLGRFPPSERPPIDLSFIRETQDPLPT